MCAALGGFAAFTVTSHAPTDMILRDGRKPQFVATTTAVVNGMSLHQCEAVHQQPQGTQYVVVEVQ